MCPGARTEWVKFWSTHSVSSSKFYFTFVCWILWICLYQLVDMTVEEISPWKERLIQVWKTCKETWFWTCWWMNDNCLSLCCPDNDIGVAASWQPKSMKSRSDRLVTSSTEVQYLYAGKEISFVLFFPLTRSFQTAACASRKCDIFFYNGRITLLLKMKKILYLYPFSEQIRKIQRHLAVVLASVYEAMSLPTPGCFGRGACLFVCLFVW